MTKFFKNIIILSAFFATTLLVSSCCQQCKECDLTLKYEWKISNKGFNIINMDNDCLIASEIYYVSNPNGIGNVQYVKDSGNFVINKLSGHVIDTVFRFIPKTAENKYLSEVGETRESGLFFGTKVSQFTISDNYKGYKIVLQEWYKNIRQSNNELNSVLIFKDNKKVGENCLPRIFDFTYDKESVYIYSDTAIYKFNFEELIKQSIEKQER